MKVILYFLTIVNYEDRPGDPADNGYMLTLGTGGVNRKMPGMTGNNHSLIRSSCSSSWGLMWIITSPTLGKPQK